MALTVFTRTYELSDFDKREILRYAGVKRDGGVTDELLNVLRECIDAVQGKLSLKVCWCELPVRCEGDVVRLGEVTLTSHSLSRVLDGCDGAVVFAATVGIELDRLIARSSCTSQARALMLDAIGAERIESLCEAFCEDIKKEKSEVRPRFSPGYGDLPLDTQRSIFALLDCHKRIGLSLNESLLMSPSKSVSAIVGVCNKERE